jgi:hypothetical protein
VRHREPIRRATRSSHRIHPAHQASRLRKAQSKQISSSARFVPIDHNMAPGEKQSASRSRCLRCARPSDARADVAINPASRSCASRSRDHRR